MGVRWEEQVDELMWERSGALEERSAGKEGRWRLSSGEQGGSWETSSPRGGPWAGSGSNNYFQTLEREWRKGRATCYKTRPLHSTGPGQWFKAVLKREVSLVCHRPP